MATTWQPRSRGKAARHVLSMERESRIAQRGGERASGRERSKSCYLTLRPSPGKSGQLRFALRQEQPAPPRNAIAGGQRWSGGPRSGPKRCATRTDVHPCVRREISKFRSGVGSCHWLRASKRPMSADSSHSRDRDRIGNFDPKPDLRSVNSDDGPCPLKRPCRRSWNGAVGAYRPLRPVPAKVSLQIRQQPKSEMGILKIGV
jgi:hypothetical protein